MTPPEIFSELYLSASRLSDKLSTFSGKIDTRKLLLDVDFLRFAELVEETTGDIEALAGRLSEIPTGALLSSFLKKKIDQLCTAKSRCLKQLESFQESSRCWKDTGFGRIFYERLARVHTHVIFQDILTRYNVLLEEMESAHSASIESLREILNMEINKSRTELVIEETELTELRQELFPSEVSLKEQREAAIDQLEIKELDLEHKIRSIDMLQTNIQGLEIQVAQLVQERLRVQEQLMMKRESLRSGIREIVRLEKLIAQIERDISDRLVAFQEQLEGLEQKRLAILADETLTEEERARLLAELDAEIAVIREKHEADQQLLKDKCEELKVLSKSVTEDLDLFKDELMKKHMDEIRELEAMMENASPSELVLLKAKIAALQQEFEENMEMLERAKARPHYLEDEFGRYYINEAGQKVYQRDSNASQYIMDENGEWVKVKDAVEIQKDEKGEFFIDSFGKKIYTKKYFEDEFGKYYIDSRGKRIYLEPSETSVVPEPTEPVPESVSSESEECLEPASESEMRISEKLRQQRASDCKYVQDSVGLALRKGLALTILYQPEDPIEFLAKFLDKFHRDQTKEAERAQLMGRVMQIKQQMGEAISELQVPSFVQIETHGGKDIATNLDNTFQIVLKKKLKKN
ncbi:conserved hypothetical protein [Culex quinquefasciatus]|uniref:Uncharacterized protein n=1 Tax=Culex quinquefasciatus TaxID=7176 RepID=B0WWM9_CULQU|nr:conserved hypothetical protein [Culex quinquefasciatus]|eukprot:XP_001861801.1 conserved hypothetical protein [Culex quinquefasciatus]